jgi:hypothetical protein
MESKNREKMLLIIVAVCIGLYVVNYVIISPLIAAWHARQVKINDLRDNIQTGDLIVKSAASIDEQWDRMRTNTLSTNATVQESQLYKAFQAWSTTSKVVLVSQKATSKSADENDTSYANEEWHADVTGSLEQIVNFLYSVETGPPGLKVDSVELSARDERGTQLALGLTVSGLILTPTNSP